MNKIVSFVLLLGLALAGKHSVAKHNWGNEFTDEYTSYMDGDLKYQWTLYYDAYYEELYEPVLGGKWAQTETWGLLLNSEIVFDFNAIFWQYYQWGFTTTVTLASTSSKLSVTYIRPEALFFETDPTTTVAPDFDINFSLDQYFSFIDLSTEVYEYSLYETGSFVAYLENSATADLWKSRATLATLEANDWAGDDEEDYYYSWHLSKYLVEHSMGMQSWYPH